MLQKICEEHTLPLCTVPFHEGEYVLNHFLDLTDFIITNRKDLKICEEHTLPLCTAPFHEGEYVVNQFLDLTDFIITIIGNNIQDELVGV